MSMTAQKQKRRILKSSFDIPLGETIKTFFVLTTHKGNHYEGLSFETLEQAEYMKKRILKVRNINTEIKEVKRLIYRNLLWDKNEYVEVRTKGVL